MAFPENCTNTQCLRYRPNSRADLFIADQAVRLVEMPATTSQYQNGASAMSHSMDEIFIPSLWQVLMNRSGNLSRSHAAFYYSTA